MTKSTPRKLAYNTEYENSPEQIKKREERNLSRQRAIRAGKAHVGDSTQVDHKKMLDQGGTNDPKNTRVISRAKNEGWRKGNPGAYTQRSK